MEGYHAGAQILKQHMKKFINRPKINIEKEKYIATFGHIRGKCLDTLFKMLNDKEDVRLNNRTFDGLNKFWLICSEITKSNISDGLKFSIINMYFKQWNFKVSYDDEAFNSFYRNLIHRMKNISIEKIYKN